MYNFQIETSFVNLNPLARNPGSAPASIIYLILFYLQGSAHTGAHMGPIWVPYRLLAGFFKRQISAKPDCSRGGGGGGLYFFCMRRLEPSIYLSPLKISGISSTQFFFYPSLRLYENIRVPPPPPLPECSCIVIPGAPVSQIKLA